MEAFAAATVIFLLVCILALIVVVVFFNPKSTSSSSKTTAVTINPPVKPGVNNVSKKDYGHMYGADVNYPLSSSGRYYDNKDNNFWDNIYNQIYGQLKLDSTLSTVSGSSANVATGSNASSNVYVDSLLSGASGSSTSNAFMDYDIYSQDMASYNPF